MINDSVLSYPSMKEALMYVECSLPDRGVNITLFLSYGMTTSDLFFSLFSSPFATEQDLRSSNALSIF